VLLGKTSLVAWKEAGIFQAKEGNLIKDHCRTV
jgi:hypothetical protein